MVILCDYKLRKFQRRLQTPGEVIVPEIEPIAPDSSAIEAAPEDASNAERETATSRRGRK